MDKLQSERDETEDLLGKNETTVHWYDGINRALLPVKLTYFLGLSAWAVMKPYLPVFMYEIGLNTVQIGFLRSLEPVTVFTSSPIWGTVADKFSVHKPLMVLCLVGSAISFPLLLFVPPVPESNSMTNEYPDEVQPEVNSNITSADRLDQKGNLSFIMDDGNVTSQQRIVDTSVFSQTSLLTFLLVALLTTTDNIFNSGFYCLLDATTVDLCKLYPRQCFGRQRSLGALAVAVVSPLVGIVIDSYQTHDFQVDLYFLQSVFTPSFILYTVILVIALFPVVQIEIANTTIMPTTSFSHEVITLFSDHHVTMTFLVATVAGVCKGINAAYLFLYLEELNASKFLMSLTLVATCLPETVCLIYSGRLIRFLGYEGVFCLGLVAYILRFLGYTLVANAWMILPLETLHGICYGLLWPNCTEYANHVAPAGMSATLQAIMTALKAGIGETIGIVAGGFIFYIYGARHLFRLTALLALFALCIYCVDIWIYHRQKRHVTNDKKAMQN